MKKTISAFFFIINSFFVSCQKRDYLSENRMKNEQTTDQNLDPRNINLTIHNNTSSSSSSSSNRCCRCFCKSCICLFLISGISVGVVFLGQYFGWFSISAFPFNQIPKHQ
jgi:hypothetical protein